MADKNIVDDYYSNIKGSEIRESEPSDTKIKIKPKRKIVVKKAPVKAVENKQGTEVSSAKDVPFKPAKPGTWKKVEKKDSKQFLQKIDVVKNKPSEFKPVKSVGLKKPSIYARPYVDKKTGGSTKDMVVNSEGGNNVASRLSPPRTQIWKNKDAVAGQKTNYTKSSNAGKKFNSSHKTRGRFKSTEDTNFSFAKGNKLADTKKEEKNIEDIQQNLTNRSGETVILQNIVSLKEFSEKIGVTLPKLMGEFMKNGMMVNINSKIDFDTASIVAEAFEIKVEKNNSEGVKVEDLLTGDISILLEEDDESKLSERSPVISIMGHVDHGKTSLLDHIRKSKVTDGEAGGITQSIGAYQVEVEDKKITFLDTPGHEAFTVMRARGAKCTDIAILVVAADEGVKPQTIESINHAKEAGIPVIVAINKMDKEGANPDFVKGQLSENGLTPEDWGGDTPVVPVSAHTGFGIEDLLEIILLVSEMKELKANPNRKAIATVIESHLDLKLGPVATVLINTGTINKGDNIVCQDSYGKVKILKNHTSKNIKIAGPSEPALIVGLDKVVQGGDVLQVVSNSEMARQKSIDYKEIIARNKMQGASGIELLMSKIKAGSLKQLKVIVKADTNGALEAMKGALVKLSTAETTVSVIHSGVGSITEGDIVMGQGSGAILIGFSVNVLPAAKSVLQSADIEYINSDIIYHVTERIEKIVSGMLDPREVEVALGKAKVGGLFFTSKEFMIVGLIVQPENKLEKNALIRVIRNKKVIGHGKIESLKQGLIEVNEVEGPTECGIKFVGDLDIEMKDELEVYKIEIQK